MNSRVTPMKIALIGLGRISRKHIQAIDALGSDQIQLSAVCDIDEKKLLSTQLPNEVEKFSDLGSLLKNCKIDTAVILTESGNHAAHGMMVADHGINVVVEKPLATTLKDADLLIKACSEKNVTLNVVKQNRFNPAVVKAKQALDSGSFGRLLMGSVRVRWCREQSYYDQASWRGTWGMDGGVLANQASHHLDLLEWFFGDIKRVCAMGKNHIAQIEAVDTCNALIEFESGATGVVEATTATQPVDLEGSLSILGTEGAVEIGGFAVNQLKTWKFRDHELSHTEMMQASTTPDNVYGFGHIEFYKQLVQQFRTGRGNLVDGLEARRSLELITAIYEAMETKRHVNLRFTPQLSKFGV
jgi:UDP-N-acetyl-2-amino-2-deoxyglucuronate dehydrogenase